MRVKLLQDITENGAIKLTIRVSRRQVIPWTAGTIIEMSEASAAKYIDKGLAVAVTEESA